MERLKKPPQMIDNFFRLNMPYGIARNEKGEWIAFNREYNPLGVKESMHINRHPEKWYKYKKTLSEKTLVSLAHHPESGVLRDFEGKIIKIFFYNDKTNPVNHPGPKANKAYWEAYMNKLYILAKWELAR